MTTTTAKRRSKKKAAKPHDASEAGRRELVRSLPCPKCDAPAGAPCKSDGEAHWRLKGGGSVEALDLAEGVGAHHARLEQMGLHRPCPMCGAAAFDTCRTHQGVRIYVHGAHPGRLHPAPGEAKASAPKRAKTGPGFDGSDRACPECGAAPGAECRTKGGQYLARKKVGRKLVPTSHAARRTLPLAEVADRDTKPASAKRRERAQPPPNACYECGHVECPIHPDCGGCSSCAADRTASGTDKKLAAAVERAPELAAEATSVALSALRRDGGTQPRAAIDPSVVVEYAEAYRCGARLPPLVAFFDGESYWLADGFHRAAALESAGRTVAEVEIHQGTRRDAVLYSVGANAHHGLRRSNADKRRSVETLLRDASWSKKTDRWIAKRCAVDHKTVGRVRAELSAGAGGELPQLREGQDGKSYPATQPSRTPASATPRTTTVLDGDPGPTETCELCYGNGAEEGCLACGAVARDLDPSDVDSGDASGLEEQREPSAGAGGRIEGGEPSRSADEHVDLAQGGKSGSKPRKWRDVLELPVGPLDPQQVIEHHRRLSLVIGLTDEERGELDRARRLGLSQWFTMPDLADRMAALAGVASIDGPLVLEPSAGTGQLVSAVFRANAVDALVYAFEIDPLPLSRLREVEGSARLTCVEGDFLALTDAATFDETAHAPRRRGGWHYDVSIANTPYEGGLDGRFLEAMMRVCPRIVALLRLNALTGSERGRRVWSQVKSGEWHLTDQCLLEQRPDFEGPGDDSARSDYVVVRLAHHSVLKPAERRANTRVDWW